MKILLINPNLLGHEYAGIVKDTLPLGLLYIAGALRAAGYGSVGIIDAKVQGLGPDALLLRIKEFSPDMVGISSLSLEAGAAHALAALVKKADPRCKVVFGGAYASSSPEAIIKDPNVDFVIVGEGERTICELADAVDNGKSLSTVEGLLFRDRGAPVLNPRRAGIEDVDSIPFPAWDLLDMESYFDPSRPHGMLPIVASLRMVPIFTSRGCPYGCVYCHNIFGKKIRLRSVENVVREIELLVGKYHIDEIEIRDDIFNYDLDRAKRICDEIIARGIKVKLSFPNGLRVDLMDEELLLKLKEAGAYLIFYAIESVSPSMQEKIGKRLDLEKARKMIRLTAGLGIITCGFFMLGFPGETKEEMRATVGFAKEMPFHIADFFYVTPRPNTPLYALLKNRNIDLDRTRLHHYSKFSVNLSAASDRELKRIWAGAYAGFYLRPSQMWRIWKVLPDKKSGLRCILPVLKRCLQ